MEQTTFFINNTGGMRVQNTPLMQGDNESILIQNYILDDVGTLLKRPGYEKVNVKPIREDGAVQEITGLHQHIDRSANILLFACAGTKIYKLNTDDEFEAVSGATGYTPDIRWSIVSWINGTQDYVIFSNGVEAIQLYDVDTGVITDLSSSVNVPTGDILHVWQNYVWVADTNKPTIHRCKVNDPTIWNAADTFNTVSEYDFGVTGMLGMSFGLYVTHRDSVEVILEDSVWGFVIKPLDTVDYGCISPKSLRRVPGGCMFLSEKGIARLKGATSEIVSTQINALIDKIDPVDTENIVATNYKGRTYPRNHYFVSVPLLLTEDVRPNKNNTTLAYFYDNKAWHLFRGMDANCFALGEDSNDREILYFADKQGQVFQYDKQDALSDDKTPIETEWIKVLNLGTIQNFKRAYKLILLYQCQNNVTLDVRLQGMGDNFDWYSDTTTISLSAEGDTDKEIYTGLTRDYPFLNNQAFKMLEFGVDFKGRLLLVRFGNEEVNRDYRIIGIGVEYSVMEEVN